MGRESVTGVYGPRNHGACKLDKWIGVRFVEASSPLRQPALDMCVVGVVV